MCGGFKAFETRLHIGKSLVDGAPRLFECEHTAVQFCVGELDHARVSANAVYADQKIELDPALAIMQSISLPPEEW